MRVVKNVIGRPHKLHISAGLILQIVENLLIEGKAEKNYTQVLKNSEKDRGSLTFLCCLLHRMSRQ